MWVDFIQSVEGLGSIEREIYSVIENSFCLTAFELIHGHVFSALELKPKHQLFLGLQVGKCRYWDSSDFIVE